METYLHSFYTWALAKHGVRIGRAAGISGALGAAFPDLPSVAGTIYYVGPAYLRDGWASMDTQEILDAIYFSGPFGGTGSALHSAVPPLLILSLYIVLGLRRRDRNFVLLWFVIGWLGHTFVDFLTHVDDVRSLFWPLSDWTWSSPVSYYDPAHHGRTFSLLSNGLAFLIVVLLLIRRIRKRA